MTAANAAKIGDNLLIVLAGAPEGIRTPDLCLRRAALYPAELRARGGLDSATPILLQRPELAAIRRVRRMSAYPVRRAFPLQVPEGSALSSLDRGFTLCRGSTV